MSSIIFRANVGIAIVKQDQILLFERSDVPGAWQLPQGGIDEDETPIDAAYRELSEETGLTRDDISLLGEYPEWLAYELPKELQKPSFTGQVQRWFIFALTADETHINLQSGTYQEFIRYRWVSLQELESLAVSFRKPIYRRIVEYVSSLTEGIHL